MAQSIQNQSFDFSIRLMEMVHYLETEEKVFPLTERLLNCGNQIGVSVRLSLEASGAEQIAQRKTALAAATECCYLLSLMEKTGYLTQREAEPIRTDCALLQEQLSKKL